MSYYDPGTGRFLQRDPEPGKTDLPITSINSYIYAGNNPSNAVDPTGRGFDLGKFFKGFIVGGLFGFLGQISLGVASAVGAVNERFLDMALVTIAWDLPEGNTLPV